MLRESRFLWITVGLLGLGVPGARAAEDAAAPRLPNGVTVHLLANEEDEFLTAAYRRDVAPPLAAFVLAGTRFWDEAVLDQLRPHFYLQRTERVRIFLSAGAEAGFHLLPRLRLAAGAGGGYTVADFSGTGGSPEEGWTPLFRGEAAWEFPFQGGAFQATASYVYADLRSRGNNWFQVGGGVAW